MKVAFKKIYSHEDASSLNFAGSGDIVTFEPLTPFSVKYTQ